MKGRIGGGCGGRRRQLELQAGLVRCFRPAAATSNFIRSLRCASELRRRCHFAQTRTRRNVVSGGTEDFCWSLCTCHKPFRVPLTLLYRELFLFLLGMFFLLLFWNNLALLTVRKSIPRNDSRFGAVKYVATALTHHKLTLTPVSFHCLVSFFGEKTSTVTRCKKTANRPAREHRFRFD